MRSFSNIPETRKKASDHIIFEGHMTTEKVNIQNQTEDDIYKQTIAPIAFLETNGEESKEKDKVEVSKSLMITKM